MLSIATTVHILLSFTKCSYTLTQGHQKMNSRILRLSESANLTVEFDLET